MEWRLLWALVGAGAAAVLWASTDTSPCAAMASYPAGSYTVQQRPDRVTVLVRYQEGVRNGPRSSEIRAQALLVKAIFPDQGDGTALLQHAEVFDQSCSGFGVISASVDPALARIETSTNR